MPDQPLPSRSPREGLDPAGPRPRAGAGYRSTDTPFGAPTVTVPTVTVLTDRESPEAPDDRRAEDEDEIGLPLEELRHAKAPRTRLRTIVEWALVIGGALLVALIVRTFFVQAFWIPSDSMEPTLHEGDRVLVNKLSYKLHDVHRGDIVVFRRPAAADSGDDDIEDLIKRVIGLPGDTIETVDGVIYVNGKPLPEPYLPKGTRSDSPPVQRLVIPDGKYYVMGDNRGNSQDSRFFGPIDGDLIVGRAFSRIYPLDDIGGL